METLKDKRNFYLRVPDSLYETLWRDAKTKNCSMNRLIVDDLALLHPFIPPEKRCKISAGTKTIKLTTRMRGTLYSRVQQYASRRGTNINETILAILTSYLDNIDSDD